MKISSLLGNSGPRFVYSPFFKCADSEQDLERSVLQKEIGFYFNSYEIRTRDSLVGRANAKTMQCCPPNLGPI